MYFPRRMVAVVFESAAGVLGSFWRAVVLVFSGVGRAVVALGQDSFLADAFDQDDGLDPPVEFA